MIFDTTKTYSTLVSKENIELYELIFSKYNQDMTDHSLKEHLSKYRFPYIFLNIVGSSRWTITPLFDTPTEKDIEKFKKNNPDYIYLEHEDVLKL